MHSQPSNNRESFSVETFLSAAQKETGLADFGGDEFLEPFTVLVEALNKEARLSDMGKVAFQADTQRLLVNRLRFAEDLRQHPEILHEDVSDPIVILGLARTGTTKLLRLISADPDLQKMYFWRLLNPAPLPDSERAKEDPRIEVARQAAAVAQKLFPRFNAAHPVIAEDVDEELHLTSFSFENIVLFLMNPAPDCYEWIKHRKLDYCYSYLCKLVKYLQWQDGGKQNRPWILKSPLHIGNLASLVEVFPKATLVHCHRDLAEVIPSFCNLFEAGWQCRTDNTDSEQIGELVLDIWGTEMDKYLAQREELREKLNVLDVSYRQIQSEPMEVVSDVYGRAGLALDDSNLQPMQQWLENNPQNRHGKNTYSLEQYGLSKEKINARFALYLEQFSQYA